MKLKPYSLMHCVEQNKQTENAITPNYIMIFIIYYFLFISNLQTSDLVKL